MSNISIFAALAAVASSAVAMNLDISSSASIQNTSSTIAYGMMSYYKGNVTNSINEAVGTLPSPYYWWEAGAMWGALLDYYHYTGDPSYNPTVTEALLSQVGPNYDYVVPAQDKDEGNDDQAFWGFATMSAAEKNYPQPTTGNYTWGQLTENLWNTMVSRWDTANCDGGLRWQIYSFNNGYDYKNSVSNAALFQLSARLARFTGNQTYLDWAEKAYDWISDIGLMNSDYHVYDGASVPNCSAPNEILWTYNGAIMLYGSAVLYNHTNGSAQWQERTEGLLNATNNFFSPFDNATDIMYEPACETINSCDNDQFSFKGYLSRFMWATTLMAPWTTSEITEKLTASSQAAAQACSGPTDGVTCGQHWYEGGYDGSYGVGQQMSALETIQGLLVAGSVPPMVSSEVDSLAAVTTAASPSAATQTASPSVTKRGAGTKVGPSTLLGSMVLILFSLAL